MRWQKPVLFDGSKFKKRYGLTNDELWEEGGFIVCKKNLPDEPPIFEAPDPKKPPIKDRIDSAKTLNELKEVLKEVL